MDFGLQMGGMADAKKWNHEIVYLNAAEKEKWYNLVKAPIHDKWIQDAESKGLPGKKIYENTLKMIKNHSK
jgi:hypothetical protein